MGWRKMKLGEVLKNREERYKPNDSSISGLKRIEKINFSGQIFISEKGSNTDMIRVKKGDLVISGINVEKGALAVYVDDEDILATIHYSSYTFENSKIDIDFLKVFLRSPDFVQLLKAQVPGGIKTEIKPKHILSLEVYFPETIKEQKRIAQNFFKKEDKLNLLNEHISAQLTLLDQLNQAILQEAVQGKLVPQDPNDEPASELLKRIKAEKATLRQAQGKKKGEKPLPPIKPEEIPFEIPKNWVWCRLGEIGTTQTGTTPPTVNKEYFGKDIPFVKPADISIAGINYNNEGLTFEGLKKGVFVEKDSLLMVCIGGSTGKSNYNQKDLSCNQQINVIKGLCGITGQFLQDFLQSPYFQKAIWAKSSGGTTPIVNKSKWESIPIPLPPLSEQNRIVEKIEKLFAKTKQLKEHILANQQATGQFLKALLHQAFEVEETEKA
jgi:type I restriction enzyme S subunit